MSEPTAAERQVQDKVRALLRKAESSEFPAEADALLAKAQELITRHAIDTASLSDGADPATVSHEELDVHGSYAYERVMLWGVVANANRCRVLSHRVYGTRKVQRISLIGRPHDRELTKLLASSLEQQALARLPMANGAGSIGRSLVSQRRSFLFGFANEVNQRLERANADASREAGARTSVALAVADELDTYIADLGNVVRDTSRTGIDHDSFAKGSAAASGADLGQAKIGDSRRQLSSG